MTNDDRKNTGWCALRGYVGSGGGYPTRSPLRCCLDVRRSLDIACSISQNIQTKAAPRQITTIKNINVNAGAVNMSNIPDAM